MQPWRWLLPAVLGAGTLLASAPPAAAMCGGNIFATCPPTHNSEAAEAARQKREKRLKAVQTKKRHYPLLKKH